MALLKAFEFLAFEARFEFPIYGRASAGASILSYQQCGNRLPSSTGGAEVTGACDRTEVDSRQLKVEG
jgi:hypothetical protein